MTRILAVLNQKGGVGKTTSCVNLGAALARRGFKVLLIDIDPQANLTVHLGGDLRDVRRSTYSLLLSEHALGPAVRQTATPGLRYVPSTLALANAEIQLASAVGRELLLREAIEVWLEEENTGEDSPRAHFIIIDCPPSLGILTMNALCAANEVVLPIQTEFFALQGVAGILESLKAVQRLNRGLRLSMVVPCMWDRRTTLARDVVEEVEKYFGKLVSKTRIRNNVKLAEAPSHGMTIFEYDASSNGAKDYALLAKEVLGEPLDEPEPKPVRAKSATRAARTDEPDDDASDAAADDPTPAEGTASTAAAVPPSAPAAAVAQTPGTPASAPTTAPPDEPAAPPEVTAAVEDLGSADPDPVAEAAPQDDLTSAPQTSADDLPHEVTAERAAEPTHAATDPLPGEPTGVLTSEPMPEPTADSALDEAREPDHEPSADSTSATLPLADAAASPAGAADSPVATETHPAASPGSATATTDAADLAAESGAAQAPACSGPSDTAGDGGGDDATHSTSAAPDESSAGHRGSSGDVVPDVLDAAFAAASADATRDD